MKKFFIDLWVLWLEQMGEVRVNWPLYLLFSVIFPIVVVFGFTRLGTGLTDEMSLLYILSGSVVMSLTSDGIMGMASKVGDMKGDNSLMYYASLPISRLAFVLALLLSRFIVTIPGMIAPLVFGHFYYGFEVHLNIWLFLLIPLISLSCAVIGLFIGIFVESVSLISLISNAIMLIVMLASPIFMPYEALPLPFQWGSFLLPQTYAAAALREAILGNIGTTFFINGALVLAITAVALGYLTRFWQWRLR
jgi:ABC-2 type transport system permease protein